MIRGLWQHFLITLRLNFRSGRTLAYGYLVPVIFLLGFGSVFRGGQPQLLDQMGQILTITILGGACLGMPTALVAEREQGLWRRFQLLPIPVNALLTSVLLARAAIVAIAILMQIVLAQLIFGTPFPLHPGQFLLAYGIVLFPFLGLGLMVTALASDVPSVQALGQCLFLPMILIGGVGVPLLLLPEWAQILATFMPGRYAVEVLQACYHGSKGLSEVPFSIVALLLIGLASTAAGLGLIRWEGARRLTLHSSIWVLLALLTWTGIGTTAVWLERTEALAFHGHSTYTEIPREAIDSIRFDGLPEDHGLYTPLAPPLGDRPLRHRLREFLPRLQEWKPGLQGDTGGIYAALSASAAEVTIEAVKAAKKHGTIVSFDLNYRPSLWKSIGGHAKAQEVNREIAQYVDVMIGNEEDYTACLGYEIEGVDENLSDLPIESFQRMIERATADFPNFKATGTTLRSVKTATINDWGAMAWMDGNFYQSRHYADLEILDRVGGGDSFASGFIYGLMIKQDPQAAIEFGAAHGALAMTTPGDTTMASLSEVEKIVSGGGARVVR